MDEKKQGSIQSSDNKELNTPEENQHNNTTENMTPETAPIDVEQAQSAFQENTTASALTSGQKSGINKKVVGAAVVVVAAVVGGAVYITQQSKIDGMWANGNSTSSTQTQSNNSEALSGASIPDASQSSAQTEENLVQPEDDGNVGVTAAAPSTQAEATSPDASSAQPVTAENEVVAVEDSTAQQEKPADQEESALIETTPSADQSKAIDANSTVSEHEPDSTEASEVNASVSGVSGQEASASSSLSEAHTDSNIRDDVKAQLDEQTGQISQLKAELQQIQKQYTELLEQRVSRADVDVSLFVVNDVARLVQSADNELGIAGNLSNAVRALEMAQQTIRRTDSPILSGLAGAIASDIVMLKSAPLMNEDTLFKEVGKLIDLLDNAPLVSPDRLDHLSTVLPENTNAQPNGQEAQAAVSQDANWYDKAWEEVKSWPSQAVGMLKSDLGGLVRVEKLDDPTVALISTGQAAALKNNLKLDLRFAQQGLLNAQQGIWTSSLESVQAALLKYYNQDAPETRNALELTRTLLAIPVRPQLPQITHSVKAIEETRSQIINLGKPQE